MSSTLWTACAPSDTLICTQIQLKLWKTAFFIFIFTNCTFYWPFLIADLDLASCFSLWHLRAVSLWYLLIYLNIQVTENNTVCLLWRNWGWITGTLLQVLQPKKQMRDVFGSLTEKPDGIAAQWLASHCVGIEKKKKKRSWVWVGLLQAPSTFKNMLQSVALNAALTSDGHPWCSTADGHGSSGVPDTQDILDSWSVEV